MVKIELTFATLDEAHEALGKLAGVSYTISGDTTIIDEVVPAKGKKETPKAKNDKATKAAFATGESAKGKKKKFTIDEVRDHILSVAGDSEDQPQRVKDYMSSFGVKKISEMTEDQLVKAHEGAAEYFASFVAEEDEEDPMA